MASIRPIALLPTYNNGQTVAGVVERVVATGLGVIVVDDGCTDDTASQLAALASKHKSIHVLRHTANRGKAAALHTGFAAARAMGYSHALTIDTDGQHDPEEIPQLLALAVEKPEALILGVRRDDLPGCPSRCLLGRKLSNRLVRLECKLEVSDSQCGLRVYPLGLVEQVACAAGRFGYETEILVRAAWSGREVVQIPVTSRYEVSPRRVSHFRPLGDTLRHIALHARLVARSLAPGAAKAATRPSFVPRTGAKGRPA